ncbi:DNA gyrase inhibitor YacG [Tabrizicola sp.]|uniref:DNA gyrase inhibitor YacG n=1 Tax=Tabrizicola sp. TaxID=2005166 RepID=UPI00286A4D5F|nr:DNA gyrase inhibitor YacG [Tabrizicola sp.]
MTCPTCKKPSVAAYQPFCSRRCADVDLGRWLNESYRVPADAVEEDSDGLSEAVSKRSPPVE